MTVSKAVLEAGKSFLTSSVFMATLWAQKGAMVTDALLTLRKKRRMMKWMLGIHAKYMHLNVILPEGRCSKLHEVADSYVFRLLHSILLLKGAAV